MESNVLQTCEGLNWSNCPHRCELCVSCEMDIDCLVCKPKKKTKSYVDDGRKSSEIATKPVKKSASDILERSKRRKKVSMLQWIVKIMQISAFFWCYLAVKTIAASLKIIKFQISVFRTGNYLILLGTNFSYICATKLDHAVEFYERSFSQTHLVAKIFGTLQTFLTSKELRSALKKFAIVWIELTRIFVLISRMVMLFGVKQCERLANIFEISFFLLSRRIRLNQTNKGRNSWWIRLWSLFNAIPSIGTSVLEICRKIIRNSAVLVKNCMDLFLQLF